MVRMLTLAITFIALSAGGLGTVNAQFPTLPENASGPVSEQEMIDYLKSLDPLLDDREIKRENGTLIIPAHLTHKGEKVMVLAVVSESGIRLRVVLADAFEVRRLARPDEERLMGLNGPARRTKFGFLVRQEQALFVADYDLARKVTLGQVRDALNEFLHDLETTEPVWGPIMDRLAGVIPKKS